jgi:type I restriction enzyme, R subunit
MTEADTCRKFVVPLLQKAGWDNRNFADPAFDGDPAFATLEEIDQYGRVKDREILTPEEPEQATTEAHDTPLPSPFGHLGHLGHSDPLTLAHRKFYFDGGQVEIAAELVHELDTDGKQLRVVKLTDYTAEKVRTLCTGLEDLRARWADTIQRAEIIEQLADRGIDFQTVATQAGKPDAEPERQGRHHPPAAGAACG